MLIDIKQGVLLFQQLAQIYGKTAESNKNTHDFIKPFKYSMC